jgi:hypothetical protein
VLKAKILTIKNTDMKIQIYKALLIAGLIIASIFSLYGQSAPPPPPATPGGNGNQPVGGGAPIGAGIGFLLVMAAGYGAKKVYDARKNLGQE